MLAKAETALRRMEKGVASTSTKQAIAEMAELHYPRRRQADRDII